MFSINDQDVLLLLVSVVEVMLAVLGFVNRSFLAVLIQIC